jgi:hypothetical protein
VSPDKIRTSIPQALGSRGFGSLRRCEYRISLGLQTGIPVDTVTVQSEALVVALDSSTQLVKRLQIARTRKPVLISLNLRSTACERLYVTCITRSGPEGSTPSAACTRIGFFLVVVE